MCAAIGKGDEAAAAQDGLRGSDRSRGEGSLYIVGTGPGAPEHMTPEALQAIKDSQVIVGYTSYVKRLGALVDGKEVISSEMTPEVSRGEQAIAAALSGKRVAVVSSGDPGIYGMAGLVMELMHRQGADIQVTVVPGVTALSTAAACLGAPLMHDFAAISLSDLLTPWEVVRKRLEAAATADFVVALYNPASRSRRQGLRECRNILLRHRRPDTPVGIVRNALREGEEVILSTLEAMLEHQIDMSTTVIIGNSSTFTSNGRMVTPRSYRI